MKIETNDFYARQGEHIELDKWPTRVKPLYDGKSEYKTMLAKQVEELSEQQQLHYAAHTHAVLFIFQAMDAAGKDGAIRHVMSGINPQGCQVSSFKQPSATELQHDFLWRTTQALPERGRIGIFNRSYYEEVLVVQVHPEILKTQGFTGKTLPENLWEDRYRSIADMERHLHRNATRTVKFFLHLSKDEQHQRFLKRIDDQNKNWKFSIADVEERKYWDQYMAAYERCISATSTDIAPWYIVPADDKENARLIISEIILETFRSLRLAYPKTSEERQKELQQIRKQLIGQ
ncbi:MAG: ADP-polyphosphate phosphotransferase [Gallionella sp.]